jgi:3-phenylpropionate/trans-cinnamate dioxygenase ferredoxin reductase subunit
VGGGLASSAAARAIRQHDLEGSLLLVGQEVNRPYMRPPLSRSYLAGRRTKSDLFTVHDAWFAANRVELRTGRRVTHLDPARHGIVLDDGGEYSYDKLLLATGCAPKHLKVPGAELPNVFYLRTLEDADRMHNAIEKARHEGRLHPKGRGRVTIIGAGLLGVELSSTLSELGLAVDLVIGSAYVWPRFAGETAGRLVTRHLEAKGVKVHAQASPLRLEGDGRVQRVVLAGGETIECDFVAPALGVAVNKDLLRGTTIEAEKAILVDDRCRTSVADIYAAGDCAAVFDGLFGKYRHLDHWESAAELGRIAGSNMAGGDEHYGTVSHFATEAMGLVASVWGEGRHVERRIVRGSPKGELPDLIEFGVSPDGKISQVLAINHGGDERVLADLVRKRAPVNGNEAMLQDPAADLTKFVA